MTLAKFISENIGQILSEWEALTLALLADQDVPPQLALTPHVTPILKAIAQDLDNAATAAQPPGLAAFPGAATVAATSAALRDLAGFQLRQLGSEYRTLRLIVIHLWHRSCSQVHEDMLNDMAHFHQLVDHSLAEFITRYSDETARTRDAFLAILGHDLRSPLTAIAMAGDYLSMPGMLQGKQLQAATGIKNSAATMSSMIRNLLVYTRTRLGRKMPVTPELSDMGSICQAAVELAREEHPDYLFRVELSGNLKGEVDPVRLQQVMANLLHSAVQQGGNGEPISVILQGEPDAIRLKVETRGESVAVDALQLIVNPMVQAPFDASDADSGLSGSVGLGLFMAREIVLAHNGGITVDVPDGGGTVFDVWIPRMQSQQQKQHLARRQLRYG